MTFTIKEGDTAPALKATLKRGDGDVVDLTGVQNIEFYLEDALEGIIVEDDLSGNVSIVSASDGLIQYAWQDGDTDITGQKQAEFSVTFPSGDTETFPNSEYLYITVQNRLSE